MKFFPVMRNTHFAPVAAVGTVRTGLAITARAAALLLLFAPAVQPAIAQDQTVVVDCLPPDSVGNGRFLGYLPHAIKHPSLSLNGFDCESSGTNCNVGYGLKQVLEEVYSSDAGSTMKAIFQKIISRSNEPLVSSSSLGDISSNTIRLQSRGFVALAAYVLANNDYDPTALNPALPSASAAVNSFRTALLNTTSWMINTDNNQDDGVKWATPVTSVARAMDFYLALENAYKHYDPAEYANVNSTSLLSSTEKTDLMNAYTRLIDTLEGLRNIIPDRYNTEPGNAPLKMQVAIGYATLVWQQGPLLLGFALSWKERRSKISTFLKRAFKAAGAEAGTDRHKHWRYQSDDGKYFWAEGPYYFQLALSEVIPFWHAARINSLLSHIDDRHPGSQKPVIHSYGFNDPFREGWLLRPLHWLADLSTPDGKTPPIDDGNKSNMYNMGILRWSSAYGEASVGDKFAWIDKMNSSSYRSDHLYPVEIAIPHASVPSSNPLGEVLGNTFANRKSGDGGSNNAPVSDYARQEVVIRRKIGERNHYILLNGESGDAIVRGEGHEQGDQMQLLYYVDDTSYLVDSGYDNSAGLVNSTWNHYDDHNVMTLDPDAVKWRYIDGGVRNPIIKVIDLKTRFQSEHQSVDEIYRQTHGNIDRISAKMTLNASPKGLFGAVLNYQAFAHYYRNVLFIHDSDQPYLVDINAVSGHNYDRNNWYDMYYHGNAEYANINVLTNDGRDLGYLTWDNVYESTSTTLPSSKTNKRLYIQPFVVERHRQYSLVSSDKIRETYVDGVDKGEGVNIMKLRLSSNGPGSNSSKENFTTVAFLRALPAGEVIPRLAAIGRPEPSTGGLKWQYFTWPNNDTTTVDVVAARSAKAYADASTGDSNLYFPVPEADSFYVELPANLNYGFVRLTKKNEIWSVDPSFQLNLKKSQLRLSASGPDCIDSGSSTGHFVASPSGGKPPYSYSWSSYRICDEARGPRV